MKVAVVTLLFFVSVLVQFEPFEAVAMGPQTHRDSVMLREQNRAFADFERRIVTIPKYRVKCNYYYAEEVLYNRYGIKADMHVFESFCGTGMEEAWFADSCYEAVIDSLMYAKCGRDIYHRLEIAGDSLQRIYPHRYPNDDHGLICFKQLYDTDSVRARLSEHIKYPASAKRDTIEGTVYVWVEYDTLGNVIGSSIMKSVRADLDSVAMAGALHIGTVSPDFRWGRCQSGKFVIPVKFALKD